MDTSAEVAGALVWPGGFLSLFLVLGTAASSSTSVTLCSSSASPAGPGIVTHGCTRSGGMNPLWWLVIVAAAVAPVAVAAYLWRAAGRRSAE